MALDALITRLHAAVAAGAPLQPVMADADQQVFDEGAFPAGLFDVLLQLLASPLLREHRDSLVLMKLFEDQADLLDAGQLARLAEALPTFVAAVRDELAAFLAVEVWVTAGGAGRSVLDGLAALQPSVPPPRLAVLVHGFDWLCKKTLDAQVREQSLLRLQALHQHSHPAVAVEAGAALARRSKAARP